MKTLTIPEIACFLKENDNFLILTHRRPDGDTLGCAAALCRGLRSLGKTAAVLENPQLTDKYRPYLEGLTVPSFQEGMITVSVDVASEEMLAKNAGFPVRLLLDHHSTNPGFAEEGLILPEAAATGEVVFDVLEALGVTLNQAMAEAIYVAVSTDTGCFRYSNTTAKTLRVAAACLEAGAKTYPINQEMFEKRRFARLRMDAYITEHLAFYAGGKLAIAAIPLEAEKSCGVTEDDMESVSTFARNIEGVCLAVTMRTLPDGQTKLSVRSAPGYDAAALCALFGGGGHKAAAGATLPMEQGEAKQAVENAFRQLGYL